MPTGFTTITASRIQDASGEPLAAGRVTFYPVSSLGAPVSAIAGGGGGTILQSGVVFLVVGGAITTDLFGRTAQVADTALTTPINIAYRVTITDASGVDVQGPGYGLVQPSGSSWSLDTYQPFQPLLVTTLIGATGPQGPPGVVSLAQLSAVVQKAASLDTSVGANLFDPSKVTPGAVLLANGTIRADGTVLGWDLADFIFCYGFGTMVANVPLGATSSTFGSVCFYDASFAFLSSITGVVAAGTAITVPSAATFMRTFVPVLSSSGQTPLVNINAMGVYSGSTVPTPFAPFGFASQGQLSAGIVASAENAIAQIRAAGPRSVNLFSMTRSTTPGVITPTGTLSTAYAGFTATDYIAVLGLTQVVANANLLYSAGVATTCFYDASLNFLSALTAAVAAGTPLTVPANAYYMRGYFATASSSGTTPLYSAAAVMIVAGATLPSSYVAFGYVTSDQLAGSGSGNAGKRLGVFGDSYSGKLAFAGLWQSVVTSRNGMTQTFQDAISGRPFSGIFSHYGGGAGTGNCDTSGVANSVETTFGCTAGTPLAASLADVDILIVELGTNDNTTTLGSPGDSITTASLYGYVANAITTILNAAPTVRLLMVGPNYNSQGPIANIQAVDVCIATVAASFGVPYLSMLKVSGINALNSGTLLVDTVHPTQATFQNIWGPTVADFVASPTVCGTGGTGSGSGGGSSTPSAQPPIVLIDTSTNLGFSLEINAGALELVPTAPVLIDTVTGTQYALAATGGSSGTTHPSLTATSGAPFPVSSLKLTDATTGTVRTLTVASGALHIA